MFYLIPYINIYIYIYVYHIYCSLYVVYCRLLSFIVVYFYIFSKFFLKYTLFHNIACLIILATNNKNRESRGFVTEGVDGRMAEYIQTNTQGLHGSVVHATVKEYLKILNYVNYSIIQLYCLYQ